MCSDCIDADSKRVGKVLDRGQCAQRRRHFPAEEPFPVLTGNRGQIPFESIRAGEEPPGQSHRGCCQFPFGGQVVTDTS